MRKFLFLFGIIIVLDKKKNSYHKNALCYRILIPLSKVDFKSDFGRQYSFILSHRAFLLYRAFRTDIALFIQTILYCIKKDVSVLSAPSHHVCGFVSSLDCI